MRFAASLRWRMLALALAVSAFVVAGVWGIQHKIVAPEFAEIERHEADANLERVAEAIAREGAQLAEHAHDYAAWDDTVAFVRGENPAWPGSNLIPETYANFAVDFALTTRADGTVAFSRAYNAERHELVEDAGLERLLRDERLHLLEHSAAGSKRGGLVASELGLLLVGTAAITSSDLALAPQGSMLFARRIDDNVVAALGERVRTALVLSPLDAPSPADAHAARHLADDPGSWHDATDPKRLLAYAALPDVAGNPAVLLRVALPRTTSLRAAGAATLSAVSAAVGGLFLLAAIWWVLSHFVLNPLERVTAHAVRVGASGDLGARLGLSNADEIGTLARAFDAMTEQLERSRAQLVDVARQAGRAEVSAAVLHDIGNVLTGATVSLGLATETVARSEAGTLGRAVALLRENEAQLGHFLENDERGRQVLPFLGELAEALAGEQHRTLEELKVLGAAMEHAAALVRAQNRSAGTKLVLEPLHPGAVASHAAALVRDTYAGCRIALSLACETHERVDLDRHRCLQVLTNLLTNAQRAVRDARDAGGAVTLRVARIAEDGADWIEFAVADDGVGIEADRLQRIFALGFSTSADGQGIGLHSAANSAREMGGSLQVESEGAGRGATFRLRIPAHPVGTS